MILKVDWLFFKNVIADAKQFQVIFITQRSLVANYPFLGQCSISIPPENVRKSCVFFTFSERIEIEHWAKWVNSPFIPNANIKASDVFRTLTKIYNGDFHK